MSDVLFPKLLGTDAIGKQTVETVNKELGLNLPNSIITHLLDGREVSIDKAIDSGKTINLMYLGTIYKNLDKANLRKIKAEIKNKISKLEVGDEGWLNGREIAAKTKEVYKDLTAKGVLLKRSKITNRKLSVPLKGNNFKILDSNG